MPMRAFDKKPFCDGTHAKIGFDGSETADRAPYIEQANGIDGPELMLTDAESLCALARFCDPNGKVWAQVARTDDPKIRAMFLRQVNDCPSGRLVAWDKATRKPIERELPVSIGLIEDPQEKCSGPIWLRGGISLVAADGFEYETRNRVTLCRCGQSQNKPFCDGTHAAIKFQGG
jgi:CDGSH-type Zn-finger protein